MSQSVYPVSTGWPVLLCLVGATGNPVGVGICHHVALQFHLGRASLRVCTGPCVWAILGKQRCGQRGGASLALPFPLEFLPSPESSLHPQPGPELPGTCKHLLLWQQD